MKKTKHTLASFILNIIVLVILVFCIIYTFYLLIPALNNVSNNESTPGESFGLAIAFAFLLLPLQLLVGVIIPAVALIPTITAVVLEAISLKKGHYTKYAPNTIAIVVSPFLLISLMVQFYISSMLISYGWIFLVMMILPLLNIIFASIVIKEKKKLAKNPFADVNS